jgi:hypothetical protein
MSNISINNIYHKNYHENTRKAGRMIALNGMLSVRTQRIWHRFLPASPGNLSSGLMFSFISMLFVGTNVKDCNGNHWRDLFCFLKSTIHKRTGV